MRALNHESVVYSYEIRIDSGQWHPIPTAAVLAAVMGSHPTEAVALNANSFNSIAFAMAPVVPSPFVPAFLLSLILQVSGDFVNYSLKFWK